MENSLKTTTLITGSWKEQLNAISRKVIDNPLILANIKSKMIEAAENGYFSFDINSNNWLSIGLPNYDRTALQYIADSLKRDGGLVCIINTYNDGTANTDNNLTISWA